MRTRIGQKMAKVAAIGFSLEKPKENKIYFVFETNILFTSSPSVVHRLLAGWVGNETSLLPNESNSYQTSSPKPVR